MAGGSPIKYLSYDFNAIMADLNSDQNLVDKEDWWKRIMAGVGDNINMHVNAGMNNAYLRMCYTRRAAIDLLSQINFTLTPQTSANGNVILYIKNSAIFPFTLTGITDMAAVTHGSSSSGSQRFETRLTSQIVSAFSETFTVAGSTLTVGRSYTTGEKVLVSSTLTLPSPLVAGTSYYVIRLSPTTIQLATSIVNAYAGVNITLSGAGTGTLSVALYSVQIAMYQQTTVAPYSVGTGDGLTVWQQFPLSDINVLTDTLVVTINSITWAKVANPVFNLPTDKVYRHFFNNDQSSYLEFGDGTYGSVALNFSIMVNYAYGGGSGSNIPLPNIVNAYAGSNVNIEGCSNPVAMTGGADPMPMATAKQLGPLIAAAQNRVVSAGDASTLILAYGGVSLVSIQPNYYGPNSFGIIGIATGGGAVGGTLQSAITAYLQPLTLMGSTLISWLVASLQSESPSVAVHLATGASWTQVQAWVSLALSLFFTERGTEFKAYFAANGVGPTETLLNSAFSISLGANDYAVVSALLGTAFTPRNFADYITLDELTTYVEENVPGIAYMTVAAPSLPITLTTLQICTLGAPPVVVQIP